MSAELERRYQRLLALYPSEHRRVYQQEMLGVLMAGARSDQRYPRVREAANLVVSAVWARLRNLPDRTGDSPWLEAAAVLSVMASLLLFARHARILAGVGAVGLRFPNGMAGIDISATTWARIACWAAVSLAVLCGWRVVAAGLAWAGVLVEVSLVTRHGLWRAALIQDATVDRFSRLSAVDVFWPLLLALVAAVLLSAAAAARRGVALLGRSGTIFTGLASAVIIIMPVIVVYATRQLSFVVDADSFRVIPQTAASIDSLIELAGHSLAFGFVALAALRPPARVRRRVITLLLSAGAMLSVIRLGPNGIAGVQRNPPILTETAQWLVLAIVPVLFVVAGAVVIRWREAGKPQDT